MIRGPVLPQQRESLWPLVAGRLDSIERGLTLVFEGVDCSAGQLGLVDGLARDASGAAVLLMLATDGDALFLARVLAAREFLDRLGDSLATALPEANLSTGVLGRIVVVGTEPVAALLERLVRLALPSTDVCRLEPFRIAGVERFAVRWLVSGAASASGGQPEFAVPLELQPVWRILRDICSRIDPSVRLDGDRYVRRVQWRGQSLGEIRVIGGGLVGVDDAEGVHELHAAQHARAFGDRLLRAFARRAGLALPATGADRVPGRDAATRLGVGGIGGISRGGETLRSTLAAARLSPEEYSALGGPASAAGGETDGAVTADDVQRIVAAQDGSWPAERSG